MTKLCDDLSARRSGTPAAAGAAKNRSSASDDFWGAGGGSGPARAAGASPALSGRGEQGRKSPPAGRGKGKGKRYQKPAAEEDFWGGGTKSGRLAAAKATTTPAPTTRTPAVNPVPAPTRAAATGTQNRPKGNTNGGGKSSTLTTKPKPKPPAVAASPYVQPPAAPPASNVSKPKSKSAGQGKPSGGGAVGGAAGTPKKATAVAVAEPTPQWSGVSCQCMGKTHDIVTNCTTCGKIACVEEGGFGCSFCAAALPRTGREPKSLSGVGSKGGGASGGASGGAAPSAALKEALERKDKLLLFDRTSASRTRVLDDQGDYFTNDNWLSKRERESGEAEEKARREEAAQRRGARREVKLSIDIMGRRVVETKEAGEGGEQEKSDEVVDAASEGVSLDFGVDARGTSGGIGGGSVGGANTTVTAQEPPAGSGQGADQRPSLENTGLRGRAKEVYDVMRANLEKQSRRQPGGKGRKGSRIAGGAGGRAEKSRVSLWRVQHDVESEDVVRRSQPGAGGGSSVGGFVPDGLDKFQPRDELPCAS